jgi:hypothetical protein
MGAKTNPSNVGSVVSVRGSNSAIMMPGVVLCRRDDTEWFYEEMANGQD